MEDRWRMARDTPPWVFLVRVTNKGVRVDAASKSDRERGCVRAYSQELTAYSREEEGIGVADVSLRVQEWRAGSDELQNFEERRGAPPSRFFANVHSAGDKVEWNQQL